MDAPDQPHALMRKSRFRAVKHGWELERIYPTKEEAEFWCDVRSDSSSHHGYYGDSLDRWEVCPADEVDSFIAEANAALGIQKVCT